MRSAALFAFLVVVFCPAAAAQPAPPIRIGATLSLSGKLAYMGQAELRGLQLAAEEINAQGGVNGRLIELLVEDNMSDARTAVSGVSSLLRLRQADLIFSAFSHITLAIKDLVAQSGKVMLYEAGVQSVAENNPLFFRDYYDSEQSGRAIAAGLLRRRYQKPAYLGELTDSCLDFARGVETGLKESGIEFVRKENYQQGQTDLRPLLLRLKGSQPDCIVVCAWRDTPLFMRQLKELGMISMPTLHFVAQNAPEADTADMRRLYEENATVTSWYGFVPDSGDERARRFADNYRTRFGEPPRADSAFSYDDLHLLALALSPCTEREKVGQKCVAGRLAGLSHEGVAGLVKFNERRVSSRNVFLVRVKDGQWTAAE